MVSVCSHRRIVKYALLIPLCLLLNKLFQLQYAKDTHGDLPVSDEDVIDGEGCEDVGSGREGGKGGG